MSKILVVDDDPGILRLLQYILSHEGYEVLTASNGIEGLRVAQQEMPDLIVLDVMLPGLDGFEVCHRLRSGPATAQMPVLMLSAKGQEVDRQTGLKAGADEFLVKPVDRPKLLDTVRDLLLRSAARPQTRARVIAFIGSRGGVGTSTVATSVSVVLAGKGHSPILVDLCWTCGVVPALMGLKPAHTLADLFKAPNGGFSREDLEVVLTPHSTGVRLLSGEQTPEEYGRVTSAGIGALLQELGAMSDYIVIDVPASPSEIVAPALGKCDFVNLVTAPGPESLARIDSAAALLSKLGVDQKQMGIVVVNRAGMRPENDLSNVNSFDGFPLMGVIPYDPEECATAEARGIPVVSGAPLSPVATGLRTLAERLLSLEQLAPPSKTGNESG